MSSAMRHTLAIVLVFVLLAPFNYSQRRTAQTRENSGERYFTKCGQSYFHAESARRVLGVNVSPQMIEELRGVTIEFGRAN